VNKKYDKMLFNFRKECNSDPSYNINDPKGHCEKWTSQRQNRNTLIPLTQITKFIDTEYSMIVPCCWRRKEVSDFRFARWMSSGALVCNNTNILNATMNLIIIKVANLILWVFTKINT
jgi:hypothetical protein